MRERGEIEEREGEKDRGGVKNGVSQYVVEEGKDHKPEFHMKYCRT